MKIIQSLITAMLISVPALGFGLSSSALAQETAKTLVTCGHQNAPRIVDADNVPLGCQVLQENYRN